MKRFYLFIYFIFILFFSSNAQHVFHKVYDYSNYYDYGISVIQTSENGYISVGNSGYSIDGTYIVKTDEKGDTLWEKFYDLSTIPAGGDQGNSIIQLNDNNYLICGAFYDSTEGSADSYLLKLSAFGDIIWFKPIDVGHNDRAIMLKQINENAFIMGGYLYNSTNTYTNLFLVKTDSLGNVQWQKEYGVTNKNDFLKSIDLTSDGGFIIGGYYENPATNSWDMFLLKTDSLGNQKWKKAFGSTADEVRGFTIATLDNGYVIVGDKKMTDNYYDGYIVKTDSLGNQQWSKTIGTTGVNEYFKIVRQLPDGSYIIAGGKPDLTGDPAGRKAWLLKLNHQGDTIWTKSYNYYGGSKQTYVEDLNLTTDGSFIATGYIINNSLPAKNDLWLLKTDSLGNTCTINPPTYEGCWEYLCTNINSQITADVDTVYITEGASVQFGTVSNFGTSWQWNFGDSIISTEQYPQHSYTSTGIKTVQLITNNDYCSDTAYYTITVFLDVGINSDIEDTRNVRFTIYPNPTRNELQVINYELQVASYKFVLLDMFGKEVLTKEINSKKQKIDISNLKQGVYLCKILENNTVLKSERLVIVK